MSDYLLISGDSHFVEPPTMWAERMDKKFRDRAPHTVKNLNGKEGEFFVCGDINPMPVAGFFGAACLRTNCRSSTRKASKRRRRACGMRLTGLGSGPRRRRGRGHLHLDGDAAVSARRRRIARRLLWRFQRRAAEYCSYDFKRLVPLGLVTLEDIPAAVAELQRIAKKGIRGAMIWAEPADDHPYSDAEYEPFWAAAQDLDMPLSLHVLTNRGGGNMAPSRKDLLLRLANMHHAVERTLTTLIYGGVLEKFPSSRSFPLRMTPAGWPTSCTGSTRCNTGWVPWVE